MRRKLVLVAYDVSDPRRLEGALNAVSGWAAGGQRSVFECLALPEDRGFLAAEMGAPLLLSKDRLGLFAVREAGTRALGLGRIAVDEPVIWVG